MEGVSLFQHVMCEICGRLLLFQSELGALAELVSLPCLRCDLLPLLQPISICFGHFLQQPALHVTLALERYAFHMPAAHA